ncbi:MAG: T9SS type B sorting domain-containing protein [Bacteroidetes bacterium]|nr:MAG: T9SS type B sorting domain-containing protein [Bacteroidota bacterium]
MVKKIKYKLFSCWLFIACCLLPTGCLLAQGTWVQKASLPASGRLTAVAFSIGTKGYLGLGYGGGYHSDFWEYDPVSDSWTQKANFGGGAHNFSVGFSIGTKGYVGTGTDVSNNTVDDFWEYDPGSNLWTQKANVGGGPRVCAAGFSVGGYGFIGTGQDITSSYMQDLWRYDPTSNSWTQMNNFLGPARSDIDRAVFVIGNKAYWGSGMASALYNDLWEYDYATNSWVQKATLPASGRRGAVGFSVCNKGFIGCGTNDLLATDYNDFWMYDPVANSWSVVTPFPGGPRLDLPSCVINNKAYIGTGAHNTFPGYLTYKDWWEFTINTGNTWTTNTTICSGNSATLTATSGSSYSWNNGQTTSSIVVTPSASTTYTVISIGACGADTGYASVTLASSITASISPNITICSGQTATLSASGGAPYLWSTGAGTSSITVSPTATSSYSVVVGSGSCSDTASAIVTVVPLAVTAGPNSTICVGQTVTLSASGGNSYSWNNGSTASAINVSPSATTNYSVAVSNGSCSGTAVVTVVVSPPPVASVQGTTICSGQTTTLTASGGGNYSWTNGSTTNPLIISPTTNTTYSVIVSIGNCADTASAIVTVNPSPSVSVSGNTTLCVGDIATLTASGGNNYTWSNGATTSSITATATATATYSVTSSNGSCTSATSITVVVSPPPIAWANGTTICAGQSAILTASGGGNYSWNNGGTTNPLIVSPTANTTYSVIVSIGSCSDTATATVTVNPSPAASAWSNITITQGQSTTLAASGGGTYLWSNGSTQNSITVSPLVTTIYCVTVTQNNCSDTACVTVTVEPIFCGYASDQLFVPDAFSPNNDTKNDELGVYYPNPDCIKEFILIIYDRWGERVFEASSIISTWDGIYNGKLMNTAVFVYFLEATLTSGEKISKKGNISLIR